MRNRAIILLCGIIVCSAISIAQTSQNVKMVKNGSDKIDVYIGNKIFTSFLYPDSLEKPVLYPIHAANETVVTRGFPVKPLIGEPTDHPHHLGLWLTYENVNGIDFWNNSYAIPKEKKSMYGWIRTEKIVSMSGGKEGNLIYHANWINIAKEILMEETTHYIFSGSGNTRQIDRITTLKAVTDITFNDAKDGLLGLRLAHELQIPAKEDQKFKDNKGNETIVKGGTDKIANGNYITSEGKHGDSAWSTRAKWCMVYGKMGSDSISIAVVDHPKNPNYPTFWHARGYGLFAANPLGEKIFTNGKSSKNLHLNPGESVTFRYRIIIENGKRTIQKSELNRAAKVFSTIY